MNGVALCAGVGGLELGLEIAFPDYRCIAAVENNPQAALRFKLRFPQAFVFRDVLQFDGRPWRGRISAISAGFPCQPHSVAGQRKGTSDDRWLWPDVARIIGEVDPRFVFLENVAGLLRDTDSAPPEPELEVEPDEPIGGMGTVLRDLAEMGFVSQWGMLRASSVGASHGRPRVFILAVADAIGGHWGTLGNSREKGGTLEDRTESGRRSHDVADTEYERGGPQLEPALYLQRQPDGEDALDGSRDLADARGAVDNPDIGERKRIEPCSDRRSILNGRLNSLFAPGPSDPRWPAILAASPHLAPALSVVETALAIALQQGPIHDEEEAQRRLHGLVDGLARRVVERRARLQCGGNGVVPLQAAVVFAVLARRLGL